MSLEHVGRIALPKDFSTFLYNILWQIPACSIAVHSHLALFSIPRELLHDLQLGSIA